MPRPRLSVVPTTRLHLNAGLQASIKMLRADAEGLTRYLEEQAEVNPHLRLEPAPMPAPGEWLPRWAGVLGGGDASLALERAEAPAASLLAHVMTAIEAQGLRTSSHRIATALAEALEPSGWIGRPLADIAKEEQVPVSEVEVVLLRLQRIEPAGLFARTLAECLMLQLVEIEKLDAVMQVILDRLDLLAAGDIVKLASLAGTTAPEITTRFRIIRSLDPKPGTQFGTLSATPIREPDLLARKTPAGEWEFSLNRSSLPSLRIIRDGASDAPALAAARALSRLVVSRNDTLLRVGREILSRQRAALDHGPWAMVALTMAEVAGALDLHESTISRVVAGTSVDTPRGTWWLRRLFSASLAGGAASGASVQAMLQRMVAEEPRDAPLSDAALALALTQSGAEVARRTVAKYRSVLGIPPAHRRRKRGFREKSGKGA